MYLDFQLELGFPVGNWISSWELDFQLGNGFPLGLAWLCMIWGYWAMMSPRLEIEVPRCSIYHEKIVISYTDNQRWVNTSYHVIMSNITWRLIPKMVSQIRF